MTDFGSFLHDAAGNGKYEIVKYFIDNGFDVNLKAGFLNANALTEAASEGHMDIVALLHESGAILDTSTFAANPLFAAIYDRHTDIAKYLIDQGIDLAAAYHIGKIENCDALEYARQYGQMEIYDYIRKAGNKMKYYKLNRGGGERLKYPEPELFGEWDNESLWMNE